MKSIKTKGGQSLRKLLLNMIRENEKKIKEGRDATECTEYVNQSLSYLGEMFTLEYK